MEFPVRKSTVFKIILIFICARPYAAKKTENKKHPEAIHSLPGYKSKINFKQYSGYLTANKGSSLFYWFVESQRSPTKDPVLLWLNGGPGCSSLDGLLSELGPFHVKDDSKKLHKNPHSWNKVANILFLETPAGVGFSYSKSKKYETDDNEVAKVNIDALHDFFKKFPRFKKNEFYVTGESYAGVYIPTLCVRLLKDKTKINFKGLAIGNGALDESMLALALPFYGYFHGLVGVTSWENITKHCCKGLASRANCKFDGDVSASCKDVMDDAMNHIQSTSLNNYNIYDNCVNSSEKSSRYSFDRQIFLELSNLAEEERTKMTDMVSGVTPCVSSDNVTNYLNQKSVRKALHVSKHSEKWTPCSDPIFKTYKKLYPNVKSLMKKLLKSKKKLRILIYGGDADTVCNYLGNQWFINDLKLPVKKEYQPWLYKGQIAGFVKYYKKNLTFLTVKGSGHMVPQDIPGPSLKMITHFLNNKPY